MNLPYLLLGLLLTLTACKKATNYTVIEDYFYPFELNEKSKTFIYKEAGTDELYFIKNTPIGSDKVISVFSNLYQTLDSSIHSTKAPFGMLENYRYDYNEQANFITLTTGHIQEDTWLGEKVEALSHIQTVDYNVNGIKTRYHFEDTFSKQSNFTFQGKSFSAIRLDRKGTISIGPSFLFVIRKSQQQAGHILLAKGIGVVSFGVESQGLKQQWDLIDIQ